MNHVEPPLVHRRLERFVSNRRRVVLRYFGRYLLGDGAAVLRDILDLDEERARAVFAETRERFAGRHRDLSRHHLRHCRRLAATVRERGDGALADRLQGLPRWWRQLVGIYASNEYSVEAAAFFNPSIVPHPDQAGLPAGTQRFVMSFRAVGEGHVSSVVFRSGTIDRYLQIELDPVRGHLLVPEVRFDGGYTHAEMEEALRDRNAWGRTVAAVLADLPEPFGLQDLDEVPPPARRGRREALQRMRLIAGSHYRIDFGTRSDLSERLIFPVADAEANGIEDARFVRFEDGDRTTWYATFTAFDGTTVGQRLLATEDFRRFRVVPLHGPGVRDKGMALFPRKVGGAYVMLGRQDGRHITVARSDRIDRWDSWRPVLSPREPWELMRLGNCGSPIETEAGWLVLTHGVGPMRRYCIGAALLDRDNPERVVGRLREPLLEPEGEEREGYVPNVVYSCGALVHGDRLVLPYAMADSASALATIDLPQLLRRLRATADG